MGYHTDFTGEFRITPILRPEHQAYLRKFNETRRMKRDPKVTAKRSDPIREAVDLPVGKEGEYFVGEGGFMGQGDDGNGWFDHANIIDLVDYNREPSTQHGLWCHWTPNDEGTALGWDGGEKFYSYVDWLNYIIENFLKRWGYSLTGIVRWQGERRSDNGIIVVRDSRVRVFDGSVTPMEELAIYSVGLEIPDTPANEYCYDD